jgi:hypothetical protein
MSLTMSLKMSLKTFGTRNSGLVRWTGAAFVRLRFLLLRGGLLVRR